MSGIIEKNLLLSNVINGINFSNCRLCLGKIHGKYVRLHDLVPLQPDSQQSLTLSVIITDLCGAEFSEEIPGLEAICTNCLDQVLCCTIFLNQCKSSNDLLHKVFSNITEALAVGIDTEKGHSLCVFTTDEDTKLVWINNAKEHKTKKCKKGCYDCKMEFDEFVQLEEHNLMVHGTGTCQQCFDTYSSDEEHSCGKVKYKCSDCDQLKTTKDGIKKHYDKLHQVHVCKDCGKSVQGLAKLQVHEAKHGEKNECPKCNKHYTTKEFYQKHVELCLNDKLDPHPIRSQITKEFPCNQCEKSYSTPGGLRVHMRFSHENAMPHVCDVCGKKFTAPSSLKTHMVKHTGEKKFECSLCNNKFVTKEALLYHTRRHTGEKPYSCTICNARFVNASSRAEHYKYKHIGPKLSCHICSGKFFTKQFLRQHLSRHDNPSSKLYTGRGQLPPNIPGEQNMRVKI